MPLDALSTAVTLPGHVGSSDQFGLAFPERDYLVWDPFDGERDTGVRCQQTTLRRARQRYTCWGLLGEQDHEIQPGDLYRHEKGFADGRWGCYRLCIACMDKWLTELGRPRATRPNVEAKPPRSGRLE